MQETFRGAGNGDLRSIAYLTMQDRISGHMLRPLELTEDTLDHLIRWELDSAVAKFYYQDDWKKPQTAEEIYAFYMEAMHTPAVAGYEIVQSGGQLVGFASLYDAGRSDKMALMGVMIGEKQAWGKKINSTVTAMLLVCAKNVGFRIVRAKVFKENTAAARTLEHYVAGYDGDPSGSVRYFDIHLDALSPAALARVDIVAWR